MKTNERNVDGLNLKIVYLGNLIIGITTDVGPRISYLASARRPDFNLFRILPEGGFETTEGFWKNLGGHRLWSAPESLPRTYSLDDKPIKIEVEPDTITIYSNPEHKNSIQKEIIIKSIGKMSLQVTHKIKNIGRWPIKLSCWAISAMRQNGFAIIPFSPSSISQHGLPPDRHISLWPYTDISDSRLVFDGEYIFIKQNPKIKKPFKLGTEANPGWVAYWIDGTMFVKKFKEEKQEYPDFNCNVEVYTNPDILEIETAGPLKIIEPSRYAVHTEIWTVLNVGKLKPESKYVGKISGKLEVKVTHS
ncbi:MAG: hypothetical protein A2474_05750 [Elusimicrobia bacterium RIFOXYC2_FULL_34_12]|nr:MAG: hypothetical protein A2474_05750 [Elusimicrobia bacterium RIFOXYC2_FULL_34_12]